VRGDLFYAAVVTLVGIFIIVFVQLKIVPVFQRMFSDYSQPLPEIFLRSIDLARSVAIFWWVWLLVAVAALWCAFSTRTGRFLRRSILDRMLTPLRELYAADVLQKISIASRAGRPIQSVLSTLARYHFAPAIRHKLLFVRNEVEQGAEVWHSMQEVDLLNHAEMRLLNTAERVGNRFWVLQQLASVKKRRTERQLDWLASSVLPILVVALAGLVLFQAVTVLVPLVKLIEGHLY